MKRCGESTTMLHRLSASEINREPATTVGSLFIYEISLSFLRLLMPFLTAFYAMLAINEATFLQLLIVEYASLNGNDYSLPREFLRAGQAANFLRPARSEQKGYEVRADGQRAVTS